MYVIFTKAFLIDKTSYKVGIPVGCGTANIAVRIILPCVGKLHVSSRMIHSTTVCAIDLKAVYYYQDSIPP